MSARMHREGTKTGHGEYVTYFYSPSGYDTTGGGLSRGVAAWVCVGGQVIWQLVGPRARSCSVLEQSGDWLGSEM